jgi:hypothetical protein
MRFNHETSCPDPHPHAGRPARRPARPTGVALGARAPILLATLLSAFAFAVPAGAQVSGPHYDVPRGYTRCPHAKAWHGFFKWASTKHATCREAARFMRSFADAAGGELPSQVDGYRCRNFYWRNEDGDIYASRHTCTRDRAVVRFYGMV